ncbi:hypothetical protein EW145_g6053 [Phellinidium pouzarii]|uniref:NAD(P)-binding protein n=1 Tax=Phellinidium pouzarii TaxID=167371 RepID=A0A4S4L2M9_9AGAM|nr:hypothetical protein EW145_g6053 [Phellinidium pouzarii]
MATLAGKTIVVVGGSSGIGYGVAKAALLSRAEQVIIGSSSQTKVNGALARLQAELTAIGGAAVEGKLTGEIVNARDSASVKGLFKRIGVIDHLVWTSGDPLRLGFPDIDLNLNKDVFDVRFWGAAIAAQSAQFRRGGSVTLSVGSALVKPRKSWSMMAGVLGAVDSLTRGLAVDLAPVRVNVVCPGIVKTELWDPVAPEVKNKMFEDAARTLLVQHVADADEVAEAYLFLMKCGYITGQRIEVDGGNKFV